MDELRAENVAAVWLAGAWHDIDAGTLERRPAKWLGGEPMPLLQWREKGKVVLAQAAAVQAVRLASDLSPEDPRPGLQLDPMHDAPVYEPRPSLARLGPPKPAVTSPPASTNVTGVGEPAPPMPSETDRMNVTPRPVPA